MIKSNKIYKIILVSVILSLILFQLYKDSNSNEKLQNFELDKLAKNATRIENFREYFSNIDTPFYAYFRSKSNEFFYNYLENNKKGPFFQPKIIDKSSIKKEVDFFNIKEVWQLSNENFYRLGIFKENKMDYQILVAKKTESSIAIPKLYLADMKVGNVSEQVRDLSKRPALIRINNVIIILLPEKNTSE